MMSADLSDVTDTIGNLREGVCNLLDLALSDVSTSLEEIAPSLKEIASSLDYMNQTSALARGGDQKNDD